MYTPTDQDFIAALTAPKKTNDPLKLEAVRNVLVGIWDNKENVIRLFETHTRNEAGALIQKLNQLLPAKKSEISSKTQGMEACSLMLVGLYHLFDAFLCLKSSDQHSFLNSLNCEQTQFREVVNNKISTTAIK